MNFNRQTHRLARCCCLVLALIFAGADVRAQKTTIPLVVTVRDDQGAVVPGAYVNLREAGCPCVTCPDGKTCEAECCRCSEPGCGCCTAAVSTTDDGGNATFNIEAGLYNAQVKAAGFEAYEVKNLQVSPGQSNRVEITLKPGRARPDPLSKGSYNYDKVRTLIVEAVGKGNQAPTSVHIKSLGCSCGACPAGTTCSSGCCDCRSGGCVCCIDVSEAMIGPLFQIAVPPGEYEVSFVRDGKRYGTLSGISVGTKGKTVRLPVVLVEGLSPK